MCVEKRKKLGREANAEHPDFPRVASSCGPARALLDALNARVLALDPGLHQARVSKNQDRRASDEPEKRRQRCSPPQQRKTDDEEGGVERLLGDDVFADLERLGGCSVKRDLD